jgi:hypothetical protein
MEIAPDLEINTICEAYIFFIARHLDRPAPGGTNFAGV